MASLAELNQYLYPYARLLYQYGQKLAPELSVTSVWRSTVEQQRLYDRFVRGESDLPAAPPGRSYHEFRLAFDLARPNVNPREDLLLVHLGKIWNAVGGLWKSSDPVHFQA